MPDQPLARVTRRRDRAIAGRPTVPEVLRFPLSPSLEQREVEREPDRPRVDAREQRSIAFQLAAIALTFVVEKVLEIRALARPSLVVHGPNRWFKRSRTGQVALRLRSPYSDWTISIVMSPLESTAAARRTRPASAAASDSRPWRARTPRYVAHPSLLRWAVS